MRLTAPAKINLALHVVGQRDDGYHLLDSLVVFTEFGDVLDTQEGAGLSLRVSGPFSDGVPEDRRNLVWQAAEIAAFCGTIHLEKHLPHGAGIGGGSSDAAAILRAHGGAARALELGADVPVCLSERPQRMEGIGEAVSAVSGVPSFDLVLVNPGVHMPTPAVFRALTRKDNAGMGVVPEHVTLAWLRGQRNDLEAAARDVSAQIAVCLESLHDAELARMSGSGSTCFGIYPDAQSAAAAAARIAAARPDWWVVATRSISSAG